MLLVTAALEEELRIGLALCREKEKVPHRNLGLWQAKRNDKTIAFLKGGIGPARSAASLEEALKIIEPSHILIIGYAGALDAELRLGDLVAVEKALAFSLDKNNPTWEDVRLEGTFELMHCESLAQSAKSVGLNAYTGDVLTSSYVLGNPAHKKILYDRFHASIVDMETAAFARIAALKSVPISCIRVVSDEARDTFLAPFSYDPSTPLATRVGKLVRKGMVRTFREWKEHSLVANKNLSRFLSHYL